MFKKISKQYFFPVTLFIAWRVAIYLYQLLLQPHMYMSQISKWFVSDRFRIYESWTNNFDASIFIAIAKDGYRYPLQAFMPLWPALIKISLFISDNVFMNVFVLNLIIGFLVFCLFYRLANLVMPTSEAKLALWFLCAYPATFFMISGYAEGLLGIFVLSAFIFSEKKYFLISSIFTALAGITRITGLAIIPAQFFADKPLKQKLVGAGIGLTGISVYMLYLQLKFHDALLFVKSHEAWCKYWGNCDQPNFIFSLSANVLGELQRAGQLQYSFLSVDIVFTILFVVLVIGAFKVLPKSYAVYCLSLLIMALMSGSVWNMTRYMLSAYPLFMIIPKYVKSKTLTFVILILSFGLQLVLIDYYSNKYYVS